MKLGVDFSFDKELHEFRDLRVNPSRRVPSLTQLFDEAGLYGKEKKHYTELSSRRGTAVHQTIEAWHRGKLLNAHAKIKPFLEQWILLVDHIGFKPVVIEEPMMHSSGLFAGIPDYIGTDNRGRLVLIEAKSSPYGVIHPVAVLQTTGQMLLAWERKIYPSERFAVCLDGKSSMPKTETYPMDTIGRQITQFRSLVHSHWTKREYTGNEILTEEQWKPTW